MPSLRIASRVQAFGDTIPGALAEPLQRYVDWERFASGMPAREVTSNRLVIDPGGTATLGSVLSFSGFAAGALYDLKAHPSKPGRYQVRYKSGATAQLGGFDLADLAIPANTYAITTNGDGSINLENTGVTFTPFAVKRGDTIYLAGSQFGDTGPWNIENQGFWTVVACSASGANPGVKLTLKRRDANDPVGVAETVTSAAATDIQHVITAPAVLIVGPAAYSGVWAATEGAKGWFSIDSAETLPDLLNDATMQFLSVASEEFIGYARVEADGLAVVKVASVDASLVASIIRPVKFSDPLAAAVGGWWESYGFYTEVQVENPGDQPLNVNVIVATLTS